MVDLPTPTKPMSTTGAITSVSQNDMRPVVHAGLAIARARQPPAASPARAHQRGVSASPMNKSLHLRSSLGRREATDPKPRPSQVQIDQRLGEELVGRVLVLGHHPRFGELAVADMAHEHVPVLQGSPLALAATDIDPDRMLVVGHDVVEVDAESAAAELRNLGEEAKDRVHAAVVTRELAAARHMPDGVLIEQLSECVDVALGEGIEASADKLLVGVGHNSSNPLEW